MTYLDKVLEILKDGEEHKLNKEDIMKDIHVHKIPYVIQAIKDGMDKGKIKKINNPESNLLWKDHYYVIIQDDVVNTAVEYLETKLPEINKIQ